MDLLVADIIVILNWFNSRWSYFGFQLGVSKFFFRKGDTHKGRPIKGISSRVCASNEDLLMFLIKVGNFRISSKV